MCQYVSLRMTYMGLASLLLDSRSRMKSGMKIINGMIFLFPVISGSFASFYYFGYCFYMMMHVCTTSTTTAESPCFSDGLRPSIASLLALLSPICIAAPPEKVE